MTADNNAAIWRLASLWLQKNYDYVWLKTMLERGRNMTASDATLITGSSHALNAVYEPAWSHAVNCSMHSQDLYYDFRCAREVLSAHSPRLNGGVFSRCFIVMGYYIAFQDLSLSTSLRESLISGIYYPILNDAHNWDTPRMHDRWAGFGDVPDRVKSVCEKAARLKILENGTYYADIRRRGTFFDLGGKKWSEISEEDRQALGKHRAQMHNHLFQHKHSFEENKRILKDFVRFLYENDVLPIVVITPFTDGYNRNVLPEMKEAVLELVDSVPDDVHYVDFNDEPLFEPDDFMDTDHLSAQGAKKVSGILAELYGR